MKKKFKVLFRICNGTPCTNQTDKIEQNLEKTKVLFLIVPCSCDEFRKKNRWLLLECILIWCFKEYTSMAYNTETDPIIFLLIYV